MASLEDIYGQATRVETGETVNATLVMHDGDGTAREIAVPKNLQKCGVVGDLAKLGKTILVYQYRGGPVVRVIDVGDDAVSVAVPDREDAFVLPLDTAVYYEPWFMDRGSYLFWVGGAMGWAKLATEYDAIACMDALDDRDRVIREMRRGGVTMRCTVCGANCYGDGSADCDCDAHDRGRAMGGL